MAYNKSNSKDTSFNYKDNVFSFQELLDYIRNNPNETGIWEWGRNNIENFNNIINTTPNNTNGAPSLVLHDIPEFNKDAFNKENGISSENPLPDSSSGNSLYGPDDSDSSLNQETITPESVLTSNSSSGNAPPSESITTKVEPPLRPETLLNNPESELIQKLQKDLNKQYNPKKLWWELNLKHNNYNVYPELMPLSEREAWDKTYDQLKKLGDSNENINKLLLNDKYRSELLKRHAGDLSAITDDDLKTEVEGIDKDFTAKSLIWDRSAWMTHHLGSMINSKLRSLKSNVIYNNTADTTLDTVSQVGASIGGPAGVITAGIAQTLKGLDNSISKSVDFKANLELLASTGASYGNISSKISEAESKAGDYSLFNFGAANKAQKLVDLANLYTATLDRINKKQEDWNDASNNLFNEVATDVRLSGNLNNFYLSAKKGGILNKAALISNNIKNNKITIEILYTDVPPLFKAGGSINIVDTWEFTPAPREEEKKDTWTFQSAPVNFIDSLIPLKEIQEFKHGGEMNLIPEGALHARKHNLEEIDENLKGNITSKGIPVISETEDGKIQQHAEIEHSEIIFRLEVTERIEEANKKYNSEDTKQSEKDAIAIEIGKLLVDEILYNTDDKTNLINNN